MIYIVSFGYQSILTFFLKREELEFEPGNLARGARRGMEQATVRGQVVCAPRTRAPGINSRFGY
jgi:hypothetical protein